MSGHLFVVRGLLETVRHDVAIIPTAGNFSVRPYWKPVLGGSRRSHEPPGWKTRRPPFALSGHPDFQHVWFLDVIGRGARGTTELVTNVEELLRTLAEQVTKSRTGRSKPLLVMPVPGIEGGGKGRYQGHVVRDIVPVLQRAVEEHDLDVALVIKDASVYAAVQHVRRDSAARPLSSELDGAARRLAELIRDKKLAIFFGAGISIGAGLPTWQGLLDELAKGAEVPVANLAELSSQDQAQLIAMRSKTLGESVIRIVGKHTTPALTHALLASFGVKEAVTTNYDHLYESAVEATGSGVASVLPWEPIGADGRWVLKMHGDIKDPKSIVLTRSDFVHYDTLARPSGALLQAMLLTKHVLIVGASMSDDNVVRLAYEVNAYLRQSKRTDGYGTLIDIGTSALMQEIWQGQLTWLTMPGAGKERERNLDIFLDRVALHASTDSPWLLDERFADLLKQDRAVATEARELFGRLPAGPEWEPLRSAMLNLGVNSGEVNNKTT